MTSWSDSLTPAAPVRMQRVAVVAPRGVLRDVLVRVADAGCVELDRADDTARGTGPAAQRLQAMRVEPAMPVLSRTAPDLDALRAAGRADLLAGEAQVESYREAAVRHGTVVALAGWCPVTEVPRLGSTLADVGGAVVPLRSPRGIDPPTQLPATGPVRRSLVPLVRTYGTVPYADVDPTLPAGIAYVVMFGMMFGDAGHGALLLLGALLLRLGRPRGLASLRPVWPFVAGAGLTSTLAGFAYGEFFGPTGVLPVLWLNPLDEPVRLLASAVGFGAFLLALAYAAGIVNRWRESGPGGALYAPSGIAGASVFLGFALAAGGVVRHLPVLTVSGSVIALAGLALAGTGLFAQSGGGASGGLQTGIQLFDVVVRIGSNTLSFARLAAFGLTHAALGGIVWQGTTGLARGGSATLVAAPVVFVLGNALAFALEALVAGVQALRLEFYELFSRVFDVEGRPFRPWHVPTQHGVSAQHGTEAMT
ncbi:V-type ATPase 116kDa subunit family protein [Streptomyces sp. NBC_01451]|uniref:V-type ATPase 116kDa subunit family protein n=1 Tax=Streptomyces sp. NBC_01451 TaxID=2903872 RepID=UPI002E37DDC8|nr:V-type ATPase 116kDa subunit family protein [Streptomyces sp. NBC_01451]